MKFFKCLLFWEEKVPFQGLHNPELCYYPRCCTIRTKQLEGVDLRKMLTKVLLQLLTFGLTSSFATLQSHSHKEAMNDIRIGIFNNYSSKHLDVKAIHGIHHCTKRQRKIEKQTYLWGKCVTGWWEANWEPHNSPNGCLVVCIWWVSTFLLSKSKTSRGATTSSSLTSPHQPRRLPGVSFPPTRLPTHLAPTCPLDVFLHLLWHLQAKNLTHQIHEID